MFLSQFIFFVSGYAIHVAAARNVSPAEYGIFGVVMSVFSITYIFLSTGLPDSISRLVSKGNDPKIVYNLALKYQLTFSLILFFILYSFAPLLSQFLNDSNLEYYIKLVSFLIPIRAIFHINRGFLNGLSKFYHSSFSSITDSLSKLVFTLLLLYLGYGISSLFLGYILAAILALLFTIVVMKSIDLPEGKVPSRKELVKFSIPIIIFMISFTVIEALDIIFVKSILENPSEVGYYTSVKALSSPILGLGLAISYTSLPTISSLKKENNTNAIQEFIGFTNNILFIIITPILICIYFASSNIISIFFPEDYVKASDSLIILSFSTTFLSFLILQASLINGLGYSRIPMIVALLILPLHIFLTPYFITHYGLVGAPVSSLILSLLGNFILLFFILKICKKIIFRNNLSSVFLFNITFAAFLYFISESSYLSNHMLILSCLFFSLSYLLLLNKTDFKYPKFQ